MAAGKQIILITGANSGVGLDTAYYLTKAASNHVIMGVRSLEKGQKALDEVQARKPQGSLSLLSLDISNDESIFAAVKKVEADYGRLDVLINNAGNQVQSRAPSREELRESFETNVYGPVVLTQALTPLITASKGKKIINVSSELGSISGNAKGSGPPFTAYRMSKAALNMFTTCQQQYLKGQGVKVWSFCPGFVVTNLAGQRDGRAAMGAESSETSAQAILDIVDGKRDAQAGTFIGRYDAQFSW
ncbi:short chain dehydrogenase [Bimuria novae-zelandiae CBS 107.79]|uniref:Short chain dehydrogenase n=1 Tax=Bimuria novae-zelandiae CBS 107.79 TaxID=1447943 RepID=A0A6A5VU21_9PLEO|nr:short chain dehydrogenase [Bimuria novae-zelandiae CBS 107.79]